MAVYNIKQFIKNMTLFYLKARLSYQRYPLFCNTFDIYFNCRPVISIVKRNGCITIFIGYHVGLPMDGGSQIRLFIFRLWNVVSGRIEGTSPIISVNTLVYKIQRGLYRTIASPFCKNTDYTKASPKTEQRKFSAFFNNFNFINCNHRYSQDGS